MPIQVGDKLPDVAVFLGRPDGPIAATTAELFGAGRSVLFAVPGAFTPTCSARHLPGYVERADALCAAGMDRIACVSTNDAFVLAAWAKKNNAENILMVADGNADFVSALDLAVDQSERGMGVRARRFAMVIGDGVVEQIFVEPPGGFGVSGADHVLSVLTPD